ncbi:MAG: sulfite oxidase [Bryobacterales bacterium]|nr:sulfite oxidase [Bryobacterales bacterium]
MLSRRHWMRTLSAALAGFPTWAQSTLRFPGKRPMLVHNDFPEDLETPVEYFDSWLTPIDKFFVRQHLPRPKADPAAYRLKVHGLVHTPLSLSLDDLRKMPQFKVPATLECAGNGRGNFKPKIPGLQWTKGAIGNAEWRGVRTADLLKRAGVKPDAKFGTANGMDAGVAKTPDFIRSVPLRKLMHESTLIALEMNGQPLPELHGFPARLIVPGWDGASWVKWVNDLELSPQADKGFYFATAYKYPNFSVGPGGAAKPEEMEVLEGMAVVSFFSKPLDQAKVKIGSVPLFGVAFGGENRISRVDISTDGGATWAAARLGAENFQFAWRTFSYDWKPAKKGHYTLCARATDTSGRVQPIEAEWNPSGYLWNAIDRISVTVEA